MINPPTHPGFYWAKDKYGTWTVVDVHGTAPFFGIRGPYPLGYMQSKIGRDIDDIAEFGDEIIAPWRQNTEVQNCEPVALSEKERNTIGTFKGFLSRLSGHDIDNNTDILAEFFETLLDEKLWLTGSASPDHPTNYVWKKTIDLFDFIRYAREIYYISKDH